MLQKRLELFFLSLILVAVSILGVNYYRSYSFKHNPLPNEYLQRIHNKEQDVLEHMQRNFGFRIEFPIIITDKIPGRLYGLTSYENGRITILLNKKVMQESMDYMIESVIPHEYAHALLFYLHKNSNEKSGHSELWKETCQKLGGQDCRQYVDQQEIILSKMPFKVQ
ncbi:SprT-like domain-containing protein [Sulfurimonas paralvinellae]|uniref:SprT family zinc-dependent metalloprotease n=1 Tax=Sulfurimonas paralvinellae TaxID=317658 RepID=A0A7M1BD57_9BACT|nr:SprT-like domain-containing protein [Sulfurimonas paralvinellae]QOP46768.1 SprT family zinc-dependent metalloprotease [Sulfurimonas paralvinellae]